MHWMTTQAVVRCIISAEHGSIFGKSIYAARVLVLYVMALVPLHTFVRQRFVFGDNFLRRSQLLSGTGPVQLDFRIFVAMTPGDRRGDSRYRPSSRQDGKVSLRIRQIV